jgi:serine/threonine protein kinase
LRAIRAVAELRQPNIVSAYTAFRCGGNLVFVMEYVVGLDLRRMVKARGALAVAHACSYAHQAALGLQHAHEQGMVDRDIKPGNLMLSYKKDRAVIKLLDFGLSKATSEQSASFDRVPDTGICPSPARIRPVAACGKRPMAGTGADQIGRHDWYREGATELVNRQNKQQGIWSGTVLEENRLVATSFAILILANGRAPVFINKLRHAPLDDWNNDTDDVRNLTSMISRDHRTLLITQSLDLGDALSRIFYRRRPPFSTATALPTLTRRQGGSSASTSRSEAASSPTHAAPASISTADSNNG